MEVDKAEDRSIEVRSTRRGQRSKRGHGHRMQASHPYHLPGGSDGDESRGDEGRRFRYSVNRPLRQVASEIQRRHLIRLARANPSEGPMRETVARSSTVSTVLPNNHPVLEMLNQVLQSSVTSGWLVGPFEGVSSYRLELVVQLSAEDGDAMFGELLAGRGSWLNRDGQLEHWVPIEERIDF
jgi:hypothetical protein